MTQVTFIYIKLICFIVCIACTGYNLVKAEFKKDIYATIHYGVMVLMVTMLFTAGLR